MPHILCTRPNASDEISGIKFTKHENGMLSEEISDQQAAAFLEIPGYSVMGDERDDDNHELATMKARAAELGIDVKAAWKAPRLTAEIKRAEEAKAAAEEKAATDQAATAAAAAGDQPK